MLSRHRGLSRRPGPTPGRSRRPSLRSAGRRRRQRFPQRRPRGDERARGEVAAGSVRRDWGSTGGTGRFLPGRCSGDAERGSGASPLRASARLSALPVPPLSLVLPDAGLRLFLFRPPELVDGAHASLNLSSL